MSLGGGGSAPKPPKLKKVDIGQASDLFNKDQLAAYEGAQEEWQQRLPLLAGARDFMLGTALPELKGGIAPQATGALATAGLEEEGRRITAGRSETSTAKQLGIPLLAKEQRDRNFVENMLKTNPQVPFFGGNEALKILTANTGNINAYNLTNFGTQLNAYNAQQAQNAELLGAGGTAISGLIKSFGDYFSNRNPYTDPFSDYANVSGVGDVPFWGEGGGGDVVVGPFDQPPGGG